MARFEDGCYSCDAGRALLAKVLAGKCTMKYTKAKIGSGTIQEEQDPRTMTEVAGYVMDGQLSGVTTPVDGECQVTVQINSNNVSEGFYCTGIMLYAQDPDDGDVPYTYLVLESGPEWIRPKGADVGKLVSFDIIVAVGKVDQVTAVIDPDSIVTAGQVQQMIDEHTKKKADLGEDGKLQPDQLPDDIPADNVQFEDGETFQAKLDAGELTGPPGKDGNDGKDGAPGGTGPVGPQGEPGPKTDSIDLALSSSGWEEKKQTAQNDKLTMEGYNYIVGAAATSEENVAAYNDANIRGLDMTEEGKMTFSCDEPPTKEITVRVYRIAANEEE